jgi:hypothetical protein
VDPVSLYVELLNAALSEREQCERVPCADEALAELVRCRRQVVRREGPQADRGSATTALAEQVAYDIALARFARCVGVDCDPHRFGWPHDERKRTESVLVSRGIPLD